MKTNPNLGKWPTERYSLNVFSSVNELVFGGHQLKLCQFAFVNLIFFSFSFCHLPFFFFYCSKTKTKNTFLIFFYYSFSFFFSATYRLERNVTQPQVEFPFSLPLPLFFFFLYYWDTSSDSLALHIRWMTKKRKKLTKKKCPRVPLTVWVTTGFSSMFYIWGGFFPILFSILPLQKCSNSQGHSFLFPTQTSC